MRIKVFYEDPPEYVWKLTGKNFREIRQARRNGFTWGEIARNFKNVSPEHLSTAYCRLLKNK